jgi:hypothetical protein
MQPANGIVCPQCGTRNEKGYPFCPECGELQPGIVSRGTVSVELQDIASARIREEVVNSIKSWFPAVDALRASSALKRGNCVLIGGIDEESANRIVRALKSMKAGAWVGRGGDLGAWNLVNGGLAVSLIALTAAMFTGWGPAILLLMVAAGAPLVGALLKRKKREPLLSANAFQTRADKWIGLSTEYGKMVASLEPEEAGLLKSIARGVFDLRERLKAPSLAATAAGDITGDLYERIHETLRSAVAIAGRVCLETGEDKDVAKRELASLKDLVDDTSRWFQARESGDVQEGTALAEDLRRVKESIDSILQEVRSPNVPLQSEKTRV